MLSPKIVFAFSVLSLCYGCFAHKHVQDKEERIHYDPVDCSHLETLKLNGAFSGQNLYVENPVVMCMDSSLSFSTRQVLINGIRDTTDELNSSAYEIELQNRNFKTHEPIEIQIVYVSGYQPHLLNPEVQ